MQGGCNEVVKDAVRSFQGCNAGVLGVWTALWTGCILALALGLHGTAYADTQYQPSLAGVVQGPTPWAVYQAEEYYDGYLVYGANKYDCLLYALDLNPNDFDLVARAKLSNPNTGGKFYEVVQEGYNTNCPAWVSIPFYEGWLRQSGVTPGTGNYPQYLWAFEIYKDDYAQAKEDAETIRDGGSVGGGGGDETGPEIEQDGTYVYIDTIPNDQDRPGSMEVTTNGVAIPIQEYEIMEQFISENEEYKLWIAIGSWAGKSTSENQDQYTVTLLNSEPNYFVKYAGIWGSYKWNEGNSYAFTQSRGRATNFKNYNNKLYIITESYRNTVANLSANVNDGIRPTYSYYYGALSGIDTGGGGSGGGSGGGEDEPSPDPWPDPEPTTPTPQPPELPEPGDPTQPVEPTVPTPDPPSPPVISYPDPGAPEPDTGDPVSDNDFTPDLQGILDALNEHCIHLQEKMAACSEYLSSWLWYALKWEGNQLIVTIEFMQRYLGNNLNYNFETLIGDNHNLVEYLADRIGNDLAALVDYLEECTKWLDKKLDYQFPTFDDNSIVYWLKRLYYKKGTGTDSRPVDPVTDPFGIGEWLRNLANLLIQALEGLAPGLVGDLLEKIDLLTGKFPFSLPWDIMAVLGAFVAQPEAPSVEWPCYTYQNGQVVQVATYDVDMSAYDGVMEGVRFVGFLGFAVYTMTLVPKWVEDLTGVVESA